MLHLMQRPFFTKDFMKFGEDYFSQKSFLFFNLFTKDFMKDFMKILSSNCAEDHSVFYTLQRGQRVVCHSSSGSKRPILTDF